MNTFIVYIVYNRIDNWKQKDIYVNNWEDIVCRIVKMHKKDTVKRLKRLQ